MTAIRHAVINPLLDIACPYRAFGVMLHFIGCNVHRKKIQTFNVALGSKADIELALADVRYSPKKRTSFGTVVMSALCQKRTSHHDR